MSTMADLEARALKLAELAGGDTTMHVAAEELAGLAAGLSGFMTPYGVVKVEVKPQAIRAADLPGKWREMAAESDHQRFVLGRPDAETLRLCARMLEDALGSVGIPSDGGRS